MRSPRLLLGALGAAALGLAVSPAALAQSSGFPEGELYVYAPGCEAPGYTGPGVIRVDPVTGASSLVVKLANTIHDIGAMAFDPYRQRLVISAYLATGQPTHLWYVAADGTTQNASASFAPGGIIAHNLCATGDGRIFWATGTPTPFRWIDANEQVHTLLDADGVTPFKIDGNTHYLVQGLIYDAGTNALFVASTMPAPGFPDAAVNVRKLPLSADGTRVVGPVGNSTFEVSPLPPGASSNETPRGWSYGPNGKLALNILTIDDEVLPRMLMVDPVTTAITVWGSNGQEPPGGWSTTTGGAYTSTLGQFVVYDYFNNKLRGYAQGSSGGPGNVINASPAAVKFGDSYYVTVISVPDDACDGAGYEYGAALAGAGGIAPRLSSQGCPDVGSAFGVAIGQVVGAAPGLLIAGVQPASLPLFGGTLLVTPNLLTLPIQATGPAGVPGAGVFALPLGFSDPAFAGLVLYLQAGFVDAGAVQALSLTNGLALEIG